MPHDLILVGGGLANGLLACRLLEKHPELDLLVLEREACVGGIHTWSFHATDLTADQNRTLAPFVAHRWPGYEVRFPAFSRDLKLDYCCVTAERFRAVLEDRLGSRLRTSMDVTEAGADHVRLASGEVITARAVIDGRGYLPSPRLVSRFQIFFGQEVQLEQPHGLRLPILMDATVAQNDAYRFVYVLPFTPDTLLIEDTYYADAPELDANLLRSRITDYARREGWQIRRVLREEQGVLSVTLSGDVGGFWRDLPPGCAPSGMRAGLYHPTTGYSLPDAIRLADAITAMGSLTSGAVHRVVRRYAKANWRRGSVFRLLNRMLFLAGPPELRYRVLRRFYGLSEQLIARFYAGALLPQDKLRILIGRPPVPFGRALKAIVATGR